MKLVQQHFYHGGSVWAPTSGLLLVVSHDGRASSLMGWRPDPSTLMQKLDSLREVFPVVTESSTLTPPQAILASPLPVVALTVAMAEVLMRDFCPHPRLGALIDIQAQTMRIFLPCDAAPIGMAAWLLATEAATIIATSNENISVEQAGHLARRYREVRLVGRHHGPNQTLVALARAALQRGIPYYRLNRHGPFMQFGQGCQRKRVMETMTDDTSSIGRMLGADKYGASGFLSAQGLPTPDTHVAGSADEAVEIAHKLQFPVVIKPRSFGKGQGVSVNIVDDNGVREAFAAAAAYRGGVVVERHIEGDDYRLLVVGGRFVAAAKRIPAAVTGDGRHTVRELVAQLNRDPRRGMPFERLLECVDIDAEALAMLAALALVPESIPASGQVVPLRGTANLSRGGTAVDVTDSIHPDNRQLAERAARLVGLDVAGIDFLTPDISRSWREIPGGILEVNSTPGLRPHLASNPGRDVAGAVVEHLFAGGTQGRVPTVGITGSLGKTTTCQMVARILSEAGKTVALSTTQGAWVGANQVRAGDVAGGIMATSLLLDPDVEAGVFELSRGGLLKSGIWLDAVDVGVVLNVLDNHVGLDGVTTREDLAKVKELVVRNARKLAVLNADDPLCLGMRERVAATHTCLVSAIPDNPELLAHQAAGGMVAFLDGDGPGMALKVFEGEVCVGRLPAMDIPATLNGKFLPGALNALFAFVIAHGMGMAFYAIAGGLRGFRSSHEDNPGRMNFFHGLPFTLLAAHADGPHAMLELAHFVARHEVAGSKHLIFCSAGNRQDEYIRGMAKAVAGVFSSYVCCDWGDLRGRQPGEVARLLSESLEAAGVPADQIRMAASPVRAIEMIYAQLGPLDFLVDNTFSDSEKETWLRDRGVDLSGGPFG